MSQYTLFDRIGIKLVRAIWNHNHNIVLQSIGPSLKQGIKLSDVLSDMPTSDSPPSFEHLAALFSSNSLNHGAIGMPIRQSAYLFRIIRENKLQRILEIGRHRGGSTLLMMVAMGPRGALWSIDNGEKEQRLTKKVNKYDAEIEEVLSRFGLKANLMVGDSKTTEFKEDNLDLVFIDGDHSYEGVKSDFERFAPLLKLGGALVFDDAHPDRFFPSHIESVGRLIAEFMPSGKYKLVGHVDRLAHFVRLSI